MKHIILPETWEGPDCVVEGKVDVVTRGRQRTVDIHRVIDLILGTSAGEDFTRFGTTTLSACHGKGIEEEGKGEDGQVFLHLQTLQNLEMIRRGNWRVLISSRLSAE